MFKYTCPSCGLTYYTKEKVENAFCVSLRCGDVSTISPPIELQYEEAIKEISRNYIDAGKI